MDKELIEQLEEKYKAQGEDPKTYLKGLYHAKPVTYWDYVEVETLLSLQKPRTEFEDEFVFIGYHQVTEIVLRLIRHELQQITGDSKPDIDVFLDKLNRLNRYTQLLTSSFEIMTEGIDYDQYNEFRLALAPASGFQSAQYRMVELMCTDVSNLVMGEDRDKNISVAEYFENAYWLSAGHNKATGKKNQMLKLFEEKYLKDFKELAYKMEGKNLYRKVWELFEGEALEQAKKALRNFDYHYNIVWPLAHLKTAEKFLTRKGETISSTGSSPWQKYLHPKYQRRVFFPKFWSEEELESWPEVEV